jgi:Zn finger protein HypA/HybF involved in hydrogenase expression
LSFMDKIKNSVSKTADKAQQLVEINRLNSQISSARKEIERIYNQIGQSVYEAFSKDDLSLAEQDIVKFSQEIVKLTVSISDLEKKIRDTRNEKDCPKCQTVSPLDTKFCPKCGLNYDGVLEPASEPSKLQEVSCASCQTPNDPSSMFCVNCGNPMNESHGGIV